jgi:biopolymer transport protein ExbB
MGRAEGPEKEKRMHDVESKLSLIRTFTKLAEFGAEWVMWLLIGLACLMVIISVERLVLFLSTRIDVTGTARKLIQHLQRGDVDKARAMFEKAKSMEARMLADALSMYQDGPDAVEEIAQATLLRERQRYERAMGFLGTVGSNAPFVGLLGTVIGVILAFAELGRNPKGGLEVVGPGISEALVATAVGLLVAIPAVVLFNWFKGQLKKRIANSDFLRRVVIAQAKRAVWHGTLTQGE